MKSPVKATNKHIPTIVIQAIFKNLQPSESEK